MHNCVVQLGEKDISLYYTASSTACEAHVSINIHDTARQKQLSKKGETKKRAGSSTQVIDDFQVK